MVRPEQQGYCSLFKTKKIMVPVKIARQPDTLDIVFEYRNKDYGAYQLRRAYPRHLARALTTGLLLVTFGLILPGLLSAVSKAFPGAEAEAPTVIIGEIPPPAPDKMIVPPPKPVTPPPARPTQRFVPPVVLIDNEVPEEETTPVDVLIDSDKNIGKSNQDGDPEAPPTNEPDPSDFGPIVEYSPAPEDNKVYEFIDVNKMPAFPGGERELLIYLAKNIEYPAIARENNIQGTVALSFIVNKDGSISEVTVLKEIGGGCAKEAVRVVQGMPKWSPGEANGNPVKVRFVLPVRFQLQ